MRVDIHTHMWSETGVPGFLRDYSASRADDSSVVSGAENLLASLDVCGIDAAVAVALVHSPDMPDDEVDALNRYVAEQVSLYPQRLVGFCAVNPRSPNAAAMLRAELDAGARGMKFHGAMQELNVDDQLLYPLYEILAEAGSPILFHSGDIGVLPNKDHHTRATLFDAVACDFPELPMILGHAGRIDFNTTAGLLRKHANVYADISSVIGRDPATQTVPLRRLLEIVKTWAGSVDHVLFGSDAPLYTPAATQANLDLLLRELEDEPSRIITPEDVRAVRDENAAVFAAKYRLFDN